MKEDGTFNTMVFKKRLNQYLKAAKKDELTLEIIDGLLAELDKMNDFKATHEGFELNLDTDKYMELQDYLDATILDWQVQIILNKMIRVKTIHRYV